MMVRRLLLAGVAAIALLAAEPACAFDTVYCTNCSTTTQQLATYARQLLQLQEEITTAAQSVTIAEKAVANTLPLPNTFYRNISGDVQQILSLADQASMLRGNARAMLSRLAGEGTYPAGSLSEWQNRLATGEVEVSRATYAAARILEKQQSTLGVNATTLASLQSQAMGTTGQQATLQTIAGILTATGQQSQSHQAAMGGSMQAVLTGQAAQTAREAHIRRLATAQGQAGIKASCTAAAATGYPAVSACQTGASLTQ
jgi:P-type conjugative transfer protein TrbJ